VIFEFGLTSVYAIKRIPLLLGVGLLLICHAQLPVLVVYTLNNAVETPQVLQGPPGIGQAPRPCGPHKGDPRAIQALIYLIGSSNRNKTTKTVRK
jgi:hypothetical protein